MVVLYVLDPDQEARLQAGERVQITPFCVVFS